MPNMIDPTRQKREIEDAIELAVNSPEPSTIAAQHTYESQPELFDPEFHKRGLAWITREIRRGRAVAKRRKNAQLVIEEILGVAGLPAAFKVKGKTVKREDLTPKQVRIVITDLRKQEAPLLEKMLVVRSLMAGHTKTGRHQATWAEVSRKEAIKKAKKIGRSDELQGLLDLQEKEKRPE